MMQLTTQLNRVHLTTDRALEFFTESELTTQIGYGKDLWPLVLAKELIDNALDACESAGVAPRIIITLKANTLTIRDNGPGISASVIARSLDYTVRVSDKKNYISPTRGQLGNALKCVLVRAVRGQRSWVSRRDYDARPAASHHGRSRPHRQAPIIDLKSQATIVHSGTSVTVHWRQIASYPAGIEIAKMYRGSLSQSLSQLIRQLSRPESRRHFRPERQNRPLPIRSRPPNGPPGTAPRPTGIAPTTWRR